MDRGAWRAAVHGVAKSRTRLSDFAFTFTFCSIDYAKAFDCVDHHKLWKVLKEMGIPDHLTCLLRNLYAGQEATVRRGHRITDGFQIGKGVRQGLYNLHAEFMSLSSVTQSCLTLCDAKDFSTPGLPVHHQLLEPTQTPVRCIGDAIQPSHPLSSPSPPALNLSQHQGLFQ